MKIALAGNPNCGKTTMYNALTGQREKVGNWAGVTVERKEHAVKKIFWKGKVPVVAVDLPGAYSISPFTGEESITSEYVKQHSPDVIINVVDVTNLSRSLFFTTQLLELGIPVVVALNKSDVNQKKENSVDAHALSELLDCPVIETVSVSGRGLKEMMQAAMSVQGRQQRAPFCHAPIDTGSRESAAEADRARFSFVNEVVKKVQKKAESDQTMRLQDKIDAILTHRYVGLLAFALVMFAVFQISQAWLGAWIAEGFVLHKDTPDELFVPGLVGWIDMLGAWIDALMVNSPPLLRAVVLDGIVGGVGAVLGFLPLVMVLYFLIALLEDCGYMARATVVLDPIFKRVGLSGRSVIPFVIGAGCAVPGVMACRTIRDEHERRATALLAPFMPCGAKLPLISLFVGAFFARSAWVGTAMYFVGIVLIFLCALLINALTGYRGKRSFFIIELPEYKRPSLRKAALSMCQRGWSYIVKAGTIILVCNFAVQLMQSFAWDLRPAEQASESILATLAAPFAYLLAPIVGLVAWQLAAATITGFIAKENVVGTLAVCVVGLENLIDMQELALLQGAGQEAAGLLAISKSAALAFLMFNLFSPPCFAAIGAMNAEMKSKRWVLFGVGLQLGVGYTVAFLTFFIGTLFTGGSFGAPWMPVLGWAILVALVAVCAAVIVKNKRSARLARRSEVSV